MKAFKMIIEFINSYPVPIRGNNYEIVRWNLTVFLIFTQLHQTNIQTHLQTLKWL